MTDFSSLDPQTRCFALVGQFLHEWSNLELCIHDAIGSALKLNDLTRFIICANMQLRDKLNFLRTIVDVSKMPDSDRDHFSARLRDLAEYSFVRNMMAHDPFEPDVSGDGVIFSAVKAKGRFSLPPVVWSVQKFQDEIAVVMKYAQDMIDLRERLRDTSLDHTRVTRLITILSDTWPIDHIFRIGFPSHLYHPAQADQSFLQAIDRKDDETPPVEQK
jgi:hypothetical protein